LVHVATGIDPVTHQRRIAKGIIAIGDQAIGVLAIGGAACGLIAIGGLAIGGITLGGMSVGLALAIGGGAIGCGAAFGGFALAPIAVGGCAIGYYVTGGAAFGVHPFAANARDPVGEAFFRNSLAILMRLLPFLSGALLLIPLLVLVIAFAKTIGASFRATSRSEPGKDATPSNGQLAKTFNSVLVIGCFGVMTLASLGIGALVLLFFAYFSFAPEHAAVVEQLEAANQATRQAELHAQQVARPRHEHLNWTAAGPAISELLQQRLDLASNRIDQINEVLQEIHRDYLTIENKYAKREVVVAHQTTTVQIPAEEFNKLQQELWSRLDALLNPHQQEVMRRSLPVTPVNRAEASLGITVDDLVLPGVLGWGTVPAKIDVFKGGEWFEWEVSSQDMTSRGSERGLDPRWKRFWKEPGDSSTTTPANAP
jgi:hypothetical protein